MLAESENQVCVQAPSVQSDSVGLVSSCLLRELGLNLWCSINWRGAQGLLGAASKPSRAWGRGGEKIQQAAWAIIPGRLGCISFTSGLLGELELEPWLWRVKQVWKPLVSVAAANGPVISRCI